MSYQVIGIDVNGNEAFIAETSNREQANELMYNNAEQYQLVEIMLNEFITLSFISKSEFPKNYKKFREHIS